eukprot:3676799-Pleurochrysis_carterae.AAC.1
MVPGRGSAAAVGTARAAMLPVAAEGAAGNSQANEDVRLVRDIGGSREAAMVSKGIEEIVSKA